MTRRSFILGTLAVLGAAGTILFTPAGSWAAPTQKAAESYVVVKITGGKNGDEYKPMSISQVSSEKKRIAQENKKAKDKWTDEKKSDPKAEKPVPMKLTIVKKGFKTQQGAKEYCDKLADEADQKGDSKDSKKDTKSAS